MKEERIWFYISDYFCEVLNVTIIDGEWKQKKKKLRNNIITILYKVPEYSNSLGTN